MNDSSVNSSHQFNESSVTSQRQRTFYPYTVWLRHRWRIWAMGLVAVGLLGVFLELAEDVWMKEAFAWDAPLMLAIHRWSMPWLDKLMIGVTWIGSPGIYLLAPLTILWLWYWRRQRMTALALTVSVAGAGILGAALKILFARPRPTVFPPLISELTYSFPSGHTLAAIAFYGFIAYLLWQQDRRMGAVLAWLFALLIALSRIYLGVHYPSDVLGSFSIGLLWLGVVIGGYRYRTAQRQT